MEPAHQDTLPQDMTIYRLENFSPSGARPEIELRVQREKLEGVVVIRAGCRRARTHETDRSATLSLDRSIGQVGIGWRLRLM